MSVNKVILVGNVGKTPEIRQAGSDKVASFSLATNETYKNKQGERVNKSEWHNIVVWRGLAEICEKYVKIGSQLYLEGKIETRSWEDKEGNKKYTTEIIVDTLKMLGGKPKEEGSNQSNNTSDEIDDIEDTTDDTSY